MMTADFWHRNTETMNLSYSRLWNSILRLRITSMASIIASSLTPQPVRDEIEETSHEFLKGFAENRRRAIVAEAQRLRGRLLSIPLYAERDKRIGAESWLRLAISYEGED